MQKQCSYCSGTGRSKYYVVSGASLEARMRGGGRSMLLGGTVIIGDELDPQWREYAEAHNEIAWAQAYQLPSGVTERDRACSVCNATGSVKIYRSIGALNIGALGRPTLRLQFGDGVIAGDRMDPVERDRAEAAGQIVES